MVAEKVMCSKEKFNFVLCHHPSPDYVIHFDRAGKVRRTDCQCVRLHGVKDERTLTGGKLDGTKHDN